jgi:hypothetical protein
MIKFSILFLLLYINNTMSQNLQFTQSLYHTYENYREGSINHRRFKHADILPLINSLQNKNIFSIKKVGESALKKDIFLVTWGKGDKKIFMWSQMHGDEPTATMAIFDIFNFLKASDNFNDFRSSLFEKVTLYFMPMVNPDGADLYQRRNIFEIDINRDAVRQQTPEGILLKSVFDSLKADFGFNLHDQSTRYSAGNSFKSATISFLAPTVDYEKSVSPAREDAIKLISGLYNTLSHFIPGHIAKYSDDYEPRAFGDNFQKWGTRTILVESGGWKDDTEKQFIRKLNFLILLSAFRSIADETYKSEDPTVYDKIPFNEEYLFDLVLRNLTFNEEGHEYKIDLGINREEVSYNNAKDFYYVSNLEDVGDLSVFYGYEDYDLAGMEVFPVKTFPDEFNSISEIEKVNFIELFEMGYTNVILNDSQEKPENIKAINLPLNIWIQKPTDIIDIKRNKRADFIIKKNDKLKYVVVNGFLIDPYNIDFENKNGLIIR